MANLYDYFLRVEGVTADGRKWQNLFVPRKDIYEHLNRDGKTVDIEFFKNEYTCDGMIRNGYTIILVEFTADMPYTGESYLSGITASD
jgi:hypothetical protein